MAIIITRANKGSPLTNAEMDQNLLNINTENVDKLSKGQFLGEFDTEPDRVSVRINLGLENIDLGTF